MTAMAIIIGCIAILSIGGFLVSGTIWMLNFLYVCSYVKLCITLIKYIPQALMNYRRKSTIGWSIGNVICDFIGGILSIFQMLIISYYNYDEWASIFGYFTKFGLGMFSVAFDVLFILQHFVFYKNSEYGEIVSTNETNSIIPHKDRRLSKSYSPEMFI